MGGMGVGIYVYIQQKLTQHRKAVIFQFKEKKKHQAIVNKRRARQGLYPETIKHY